MVDFANTFLAETPALKPNRVQPVRTSISGSRSLGKGQNIARNGRATTNERVRPDANKMVYRTESANRCPLLNSNVAAESRCVSQNDVVPDLAIVSDVRVSHNQYMVAHAGQAATFYGAAIDGSELANLVVIANFQSEWVRRL